MYGVPPGFQRSDTGGTPYMRAVSVRVVRVAATRKSTRSPARKLVLVINARTVGGLLAIKNVFDSR